MSNLKENKGANVENVEENFAKFKDFGENVRREYEQVFTEMWMNLNESHLEPFAKILLERENTVLKGREQIIDSIRKNLQSQMISSLNNLWHGSGVSEALISLEMCKEKFKSYEGHKWNMDAKTPLERTRPIRMRFKENRLRYLQAQLKFQQAQLDETLQENMSLRQRIQEVKQQRIYLMESMVQYRAKFEAAKPELLRLQMKLLELPEENEIPEPDQDKA